MKRILLVPALILIGMSVFAEFETDTFPVDGGNVMITHLGHASLMFTYGDTVIYVDPIRSKVNYARMPKADIILITHGHRDHLDRYAMEKVRTPETTVIHTRATVKNIEDGTVMANGDSINILGITIEAVPAYNTTRSRVRLHPRGRDNGYILNIGGKRFYIAGDTEDTPEMRALKNIDVAFLPMNQPYTMTPSQVAVAARLFRPRVLFPYHYGRTDVSILVDLLEDERDIDVRIRKLR